MQQTKEENKQTNQGNATTQRTNYHMMKRNSVSRIAKYLDIWLFGYLAARDKRGQVGYPWREQEKCSSEALT